MGKSVQHVNLTGGEPFLRADIFEILKAYFDNANVNSILINTNGSYPKRISDLVDKLNKFLSSKTVITQFSIDSYRRNMIKLEKFQVSLTKQWNHLK